ncbi:Major Facilitator Superfamily protein [Clavibacter michiganensis subsp. michiganensis]|uniref:MFS transporter n=1 Tax=Clavibacter michiganensis TaxID=28447 RepID=UPI000B737E31|nr:MFS transporter [Clavibacter michiganensis]OUE02048.1 Major Facilitator Superfamily protein [Clavibacter michiganensis subsp. michiganensis]
MTAAPTPPPARTGYLAVLALPGALRVFLPAMLGRLSFAMVALALLLLVQARTGSFAAAGLATGAFGLANVLASPVRARLVDAHGQRPVLVALAVAHALGLVGVLAVVRIGAPVGVVVVTAALAGLAMPPLGAAMRVVWAALVPDARMRTRAYSLDAVGEEVVFTVGPLVVAALVAVADPEVAVLASAAASVTGTLGMTSSRLSRAQGARPAPPEGQPTADAARGRRAVLAAVAARVPAAPDALALVLLAAALVPVGLFLAPAMVTGYLLADAQTEPSVRTEASAWVNTAVNTGVALAAAAVGAVVDAAGPLVAALVVAGIAAPALLRRRATAERAEAPATGTAS